MTGGSLAMETLFLPDSSHSCSGRNEFSRRNGSDAFFGDRGAAVRMHRDTGTTQRFAMTRTAGKQAS